MKKIAIVGAGMSGLICALELEQLGYEPTIFETSDEIGGRVKTQIVSLTSGNSHRCDAGFQVLLTAYPEVRRYLSLSDLNLKRFDAAASVHISPSRTHAIGDPLRSVRWVWPSITAPFATWGDLWKMYRLKRFVQRKTETELFAQPHQHTIDFLRNWGFSESIIKHFFTPFYRGIFLEPALSTSSRLFLFVFKMFSEGDAAIPAAGIGEVANQIYGKLNRTEVIFNQTINPDELPEGFDAWVWPEQLRSAAQPENWNGSYNYVFEIGSSETGSTPPLNHLFLVPENLNKKVNNYHFEHVNQDGAGHLLVNATCLVQATVEEIEAELIELTGRSGLVPVVHHFIPRALPNNTPMESELDASVIRGSKWQYFVGDRLLYPSLNAAMKSGRLAAEVIHSDFNASVS